MKRKINSYLLLIIWLFQSSFSLILYKTERYRCLHEFNNHVYKSHKNITRLAFANNQVIQWEHQFKELEFNKKLYDVIDYQLSNDSIILICIHDNKEENIKSIYLLNKTKEMSQNGFNSILKKTTDLKYLFVENRIIKNFNIYKASYIRFIPIFITSVLIEIICPPPKVF